MGEHVISTVRSAARLETLVHITRDTQAPEHPWTFEHTCVLRPFTPGSQPELWAAWNALAAVTVWEAATAGHVLIVLLQTVPSGEAPGRSRHSDRRTSRSLAEAGRRLFAVSRQRKMVANDADRIRKYRARYGLEWGQVRGE